MGNSDPFIITISRQLGSGGSYLGQKIASRLNIAYLDREIVAEAAQKLKVSEDRISANDEKFDSFWQRVLKPLAYTSTIYVPPTIDLLTEEIIRDTESQVIRQVAERASAVVIGRGGFYVLRNHPRHLSIFLHAEIAFRQQRVQKLYNVSAQQALRMIESGDKARAHYIRALTGCHWASACEYDLCLNTSAFGLDQVEEIIIKALESKFGHVGIN